MQASTENITSSRPMIVTTTENIPGTRVVKTIGQVFGLTVRSRSLGGNIAAGLKSLVGGEIGSYVKLNEDSRRQALDRMVQNAAAMGANAVTMMRFDSTEMGRSMSEIVAYGTARVVEWLPTPPTPPARRAEGAHARGGMGDPRGRRPGDRYRHLRLGPVPRQPEGCRHGSGSEPTSEVFIDPALVSGCACGTTQRQANGSTAPSESRPVSSSP